MPELVHVVGLPTFGVSRDLYPEDAQWVQAIFQQDRDLGDDELNLMQQIAETRLRHLIEGLASDGLMWGGQILASDQRTVPANSFYLQRAWWLVGRLPVLTADSRQNEIGGTEAEPDTRTDLGLHEALLVTLPAPPASGGASRTDEVFLEVWVQEVASAGQTNADTTVYERGGVGNATLANSIANLVLPGNPELSRRAQLRWRVRIAQNATSPATSLAWGGDPANGTGLTFTALPYPYQSYRAGALGADLIHDQGTSVDATALATLDGFVWAIHIASVLRRPGATAILQSDILSGPPPSKLLIKVPQENILPPLDLDTGPVAVAYSYQGQVTESTVGGGGTMYDIGGYSFATNFTLAIPPGSGLRQATLGRLELLLARVAGTVGSDVTVQIAAPDNVTVLWQAIIPKEWLLDAVRPISVPVNLTIQLAQAYSIRTRPAVNVRQQGDPSGLAGTRTYSFAGDVGTTTPTWTPAATLYHTLTIGEDAPIRNIVWAQGAKVATYDYDSTGAITGFGTWEASTGAVGHTAVYDTVSHDATSGEVTQILQTAPVYTPAVVTPLGQ